MALPMRLVDGTPICYPSTMPRPSPVTDAVRALVASEDHHAWSLDELLHSVRRRIPTADYSTIFRAVAMLERQGVVDRIDLGDGKGRFESHRAHHEHVRCTSCGQVEEVPGCVVQGSMVEVQRATGYQVSGHQVVFAGLCPDCQTG
jgi:Fur family peroxide stress response transcriptional regulator